MTTVSPMAAAPLFRATSEARCSSTSVLSVRSLWKACTPQQMLSYRCTRSLGVMARMGQPGRKRAIIRAV